MWIKEGAIDVKWKPLSELQKLKGDVQERGSNEGSVPRKKALRLMKMDYNKV